MTDPVITNLYKTFSKYQLNQKVTGHYCEVCLNDEYNQFLHQTPLYQLTKDDLIGYLTSADIVDDTCNDFKYFLPRLLEIIWEDDEQSHYFFDIIWQVIAKTKNNLWSLEEQKAINDFVITYMEKVQSSGDRIKIETALDDLQEAGLQITDSLRN